MEEVPKPKHKRLSERQRKEIFLKSKDESYTTKMICEEFGISRQTLGNIKKMYTQEEEQEMEDDVKSVISVKSNVSNVSRISQVSRISLPKVEKQKREVFEKTFHEYLPRREENEVIEEVISRPETPRLVRPLEYQGDIIESLLRDKPVSRKQSIVVSPPVSEEKQVTGIYKQSESKQAMISKITAYIQSFPAKLNCLIQGDTEGYIKNLQNLNEDDLQGILSAIRYNVSNNGLNDMVMMSFSAGLGTMELLGGQVGLKLKGLREAMMNNATAVDSIKELSIEWLGEVAVSPQKRLIGIILMTGYSVHTKNSLETQLDSVLEEKIDPKNEKLQEYNDL